MRFQTLLQTNWDWRAAGNFMFGGTGGGLLLMVVAGSFPGTPHPLLGLTALAFVGLGLFLVWLEIGRPARAVNVFFHPQTSWMTREGLVATGVFGATLAGLVSGTPWLLALAGIGALGFLYCQGRILTASKGIPAWREPLVAPLIMTTGLAEGTGVLLLLLTAAGAGITWPAFVLLACLALRVSVWGAYRERFAGDSMSPTAKAELMRIDIPFVVGGNVLPAILLGVGMLVPATAGGMYFLAGLVATVAGWGVKFVLVTRASQVQGYAFGKLRKGHPLGLRASKAA